MCMIALRPITGKRGAHIPNAVIDTAMNRHADGFGYMYRDETGLHASSFAPGARKQFRKELKALDARGVEYAAHFRWATSGPKNADMAHPYIYSDPDPEVGDVAVMHNGVIGIKHDHAVESDTSAFVRLVLAELPTRWWANPAIAYLVSESIGYSKLVIMTATETVNLNDELGKWDGGIWYSSDHKPSKWTQYDGSWSSKGGTVATSNGKGGTTYVAPKGTAAMPDEAARLLAAQAESKALAPLTGKARASAVTLGLLPADGVIMTSPSAGMYRHAGHNLTALKDIDMDAGDCDYADAVICDTCSTIGDVYVIDGMYYIDMAHLVGADGDDEDMVPVNMFEEAEVIAAALS